MIALRSLRTGERCTINGYTCEIVRQARRTTFVRIVAGELAGTVVQLHYTTARGAPRMVTKGE